MHGLRRKRFITFMRQGRLTILASGSSIFASASHLLLGGILFFFLATMISLIVLMATHSAVK
jgi:hypothetical protein